MTNPSTIRNCLSPATALCFSLIALSGVLMFFHIRVPGIKVLHEILGLLFVVVGTWHVVLNWRAFCKCLGCRTAKVTLAVGLLLSIGLMTLGAGHDQHEGRGPGAGEGRRGPPWAQD